VTEHHSEPTGTTQPDPVGQPRTDDPVGRPAGGPPPSWQAWAPLLSAIGILIAAIGVGVAVYQVHAADSRLRLQTSAQALYEWNRRQPVNATRCLAAMSQLGIQEYEEIIRRHATKLPPSLSDTIIACFSDHDESEIPKLYSDNRLTPKGSSLLAVRVNDALNADNIVAGFVIYSVVDTRLLTPEIAGSICRDDPLIVETLRKLPGREDSFASLHRFINSPKPNGCQ
jgi:hypothetical protein